MERRLRGSYRNARIRVQDELADLSMQEIVWYAYRDGRIRETDPSREWFYAAVASARRTVRDSQAALEHSRSLAQSAGFDEDSVQGELLVGSEEVQAATEEARHSTRSSRVTNEELETLNEQLQAKVEELNTTNDDLEARSAELEGAASVLRRQQDERDVSLRNLGDGLLAATDGPAVLDRTGLPVTDTELASLLETMRPLDDEPAIGARHGLRTRVLWGERVVGRYEMPATRGGRARRVKIIAEPIRDADGEVMGALVTMHPARRTRAKAE